MFEMEGLKQNLFVCHRCGKRFRGRQDYCPRCGQPFVYEIDGLLYNSIGDQVELSPDKKRIILKERNKKRPR